MAYRSSDIPPFTEIAFRNLLNPAKIIDFLRRELKHWAGSMKNGIGSLFQSIKKTVRKIISRVQTIARTERTRVQGKARHEAIRKANQNRPEGSKAYKKQWFAQRDERTRDSHESMHGQIQWNDYYFISGAGNKLMYPGDPRAPASEVINCRCWIRMVKPV